MFRFGTGRPDDLSITEASQLIDELKSSAITQQIELNGAVGRMIAALLLGLAEIELEYRAERQAAGITPPSASVSYPFPMPRRPGKKVLLVSSRPELIRSAVRHCGPP